MTISITIDAMTAEEARNEMRALLGGGGVAAPIVAALIVDAAETPKRGRGRPPKAKSDEVTDINTDGDAVDEQVTAEAEATTPPITADDIRAAVKRLAAAKGENACWALFKKYGAKNSTTTLETGRGAEFITEAEEMVEMNDVTFAKRFPDIAPAAA